MGDTIGLGMIGAGFISEYHLAGLAAAGGAEVRVLMGRTPAQVQALAQRFAIRGRVRPDRTGQDGLASLLVAEAIYRAASTGQVATVEGAAGATGDS